MQESLGAENPSSVHKLFESACKDLSVVFQPPPAAAGSNAQPEPIRSYVQLKRQIYDQLIACDHLIPVETAFVLATSAIDCALLKSSPSGTDTVRSMLLGKAPTQVVEDVDWTQRDRVCHVRFSSSSCCCCSVSGVPI